MGQTTREERMSKIEVFSEGVDELEVKTGKKVIRIDLPDGKKSLGKMTYRKLLEEAVENGANALAKYSTNYHSLDGRIHNGIPVRLI